MPSLNQVLARVDQVATEGGSDSPFQKKMKKKKKARAPKEDIDFEFFGDLKSLNWQNLTLKNDNSTKFWRIVAKDNKVLINLCGTWPIWPSFQQKTFETSEMAEDFLQKEIALMIQEGYIQ